MKFKIEKNLMIFWTIFTSITLLLQFYPVKVSSFWMNIALFIFILYLVTLIGNIIYAIRQKDRDMLLSLLAILFVYGIFTLGLIS